jgi:outer membrane protein assembly factor BamB
MPDRSFPPDAIDNQTGNGAQTLPEEDARLVDDLRRLYQGAAADNAASLARVQARLQERAPAVAEAERASRPPIALSVQSHPMTRQKPRLFSGDPSNGSGRFWRRLSVLVASLVLVALVGSMAAVFALVHPGKHIAPTGGNSTSVASPAPTPPADPVPASGLYLVIQKDWTSSQVSKLDPQTKQPLWTQDAGTVYSSIAVYGESLFVDADTAPIADQKHGVSAFSAETGALLWHVDLPQDVVRGPNHDGPYDLGYLSQPAVRNDTLYVLARDGKLYALDVGTGKRRWTYAAPATAVFYEAAKGPNVQSIWDAPQVVIQGGVVYGALHSTLFAVDATSGRQLWTVQINNILVFNAPVYFNGALYLTAHELPHGYTGDSRQGYAYAFVAKTGRKLWQYNVGNWVLAQPTVVGPMVYFGSFNGYLYALRAGDGSLLWKYNTGGPIYEQPVVLEDTIYIDEWGYDSIEPAANAAPRSAVFALNATSGALRWHKDMGATIIFLQAVQNGQLYLGVFPGTLTILNIQDGSQLWSQCYTKLTDKYGNDQGAPPFVTLVP